jgi:tRNA threonylcarbamoyladenosine biosynthesis protein TsaB
MRGPGSFTGLRIGFAAAKGLALARNIPMVSVPTLDCMAFPWAAWPGLVLPAMDAKKDRFFTALYRKGVRESEYLDASPAEISRGIAETDEPVLLSGPAAELLRDVIGPLVQGRVFIDPSLKRGKARELLDIIIKRGILEEDAGLCSGPLYVRKSDAELTFENK